MPNAAFAATLEAAYPSVLSAGPSRSFPSSQITHQTQGTLSWCAPVAPNKKRRTNIGGIDVTHTLASQHTNSVWNSRVHRSGSHMQIPYHHASDSPFPTPTSTYQIEPNMVDQAVGVRIFPYRDYKIGIPEDLSSHLSTLQKYQESAIDANVVYDVTKLTNAFYVGLQAGHCLFWFNSPPTRRECIDSGLYILSFVEKSDLVVAGMAIASYHKYQAMEIGRILVSLPDDIYQSQKEFFSKFTIPAPRLLQPSPAGITKHDKSALLLYDSHKSSNSIIGKGVIAHPYAVISVEAPIEVSGYSSFLKVNVRVPVEIDFLTLDGSLHGLTDKITEFAFSRSTRREEVEKLLAEIGCWATGLSSLKVSNPTQPSFGILQYLRQTVQLTSGETAFLYGTKGEKVILRIRNIFDERDADILHIQCLAEA